MHIKEFAKVHGLTIRRDGSGEMIIPGKPRKASRVEDRNHIFQYSDDLLGVCIVNSTQRRWKHIQRIAVAVGMQVSQAGDDEGTLIFDQTNRRLAQLAIKLAGCSVRRTLSVARIAQLRERGLLLAARR